MQLQLEQNKERKTEIEKSLINIYTKYKTLVEKIITKCTEKALFNEADIETLKKDFNEQQEAITQFLIPDNSSPSPYTNP